jgi:cbb3-type cytochrome oxidase maturation protein
MSIIFVMIPVALLLAIAAALAFRRAVITGQYDDLSGPPVRMLDDESDPRAIEPPRGA